MTEPKKRPNTVLILAHALGWAAAMLAVALFFRDKSWSDEFLLMAPLVFVLLNGLLARRSSQQSGNRC